MVSAPQETSAANVGAATGRSQRWARLGRGWTQGELLGWLRRHGGYTLLFSFLTWLYVRPLWITPYVPATDLHAHLALVAVMDNLADPTQLQHQVFEWGSFPVPNCLYYVLTYLVSRLTGLVAASQIVLSVYVVFFLVCWASFLRAFGASRWFLSFGSLLIYNFNFIYGFVDYAFSVPIALFGMGLTLKRIQQPTVRRSLVAAFVALVLFFAHLQMFVFYCCLTGTLHVVRHRWQTTGGWPDVGRAARLVGSWLWPLLPAATLFAVWACRQLLPTDGPAHPMALGTLDNLGAVGHPWDERLGGLFLYAGDIFHDDSDIKPFVVAVVVLLAVAAARREAEPHSWADRYGIVVLSLVALLFYLLSPAHITGQAETYNRFAILLWLLPVAGLRGMRYRTKAATVAFVIVPLAVASVYHGANIAQKVTLYSEEAAGFDEVIRAARPQSRLIHMMRAQASMSRHIRLFPFRHFNQYHYIYNRGVTHDSFALRPGRLLGVKPDQRMVNFPYHPQWYEDRRLWDHYDYVLARGEPHVEQSMPDLSLVARRGSWALFELQHKPETGNPGSRTRP